MSYKPELVSEKGTKVATAAHVEDNGRMSTDRTVVGEGDHGNLGRRQSHKVDLVSNANAKLANPLGDLTDRECIKKAEAFAMENDLPVEAFTKGGLLAKRPTKFEFMEGLSDTDKELLRNEIAHPYHQPKVLYHLVIACSIAAAVQGMDESVISGAQASLSFPLLLFPLKLY